MKKVKKFFEIILKIFEKCSKIYIIDSESLISLTILYSEVL